MHFFKGDTNRRSRPANTGLASSARTGVGLMGGWEDGGSGVKSHRGAFDVATDGQLLICAAKKREKATK